MSGQPTPKRPFPHVTQLCPQGREPSPRFLRLVSSEERPQTMPYQDFCVLAVSYMAPLYNAARRMAADPQEAEDLVQDTYERALQAYHQLKSPAQCRAWLYRIMRNVFIDTYRRKQTQPQLVTCEGKYEEADDVYSTYPAATVSPEEEVLRRFSNEEIHRILATLPEDLRTIITLCDIEGLTYPEIAAVLDCPLGTVRSRLARARRALLIKFRSQAESNAFGKEE